MTNELPLFYFNPTICLVDDNILFLEALNEVFKDTYRCLTFSDPKKADEFFQAYQSPLSDLRFSREMTESEIFDTYNHFPIDITLSEITKLADKPAMRDEIAVLVIDNHMPHMTGIELCKKLKNLPFKKNLINR